MDPIDDPSAEARQRKSFVLLLVAVSVAFLWILFPLFGAVLWAVTFATLFAGLNRALQQRLHIGRTWSALLTTTLVLVLVIVPAVLISGLVAQEGTAVLQRLRSGDIDIGSFYLRIVHAMPGWMSNLLQDAGLRDLPALQQKITESATSETQPIVNRLWAFGQNTVEFTVNFFVMLYVLFFLLRDGDGLVRTIRRAVPLDARVQQRLLRTFQTVIRSTVKGNVVVAIVQGALGGLAFAVLGLPSALLWAVLMAFLSLLPTIGAALVWGPAAAYLLLTGQLWQGMALVVFGTVVIGLADNLLRPKLVGKAIRLPDYLVLVSTIGGMSLFGINGFVIGPAIATLFIASWDLEATEQLAGGRRREPMDVDVDEAPEPSATVEPRP